MESVLRYIIVPILLGSSTIIFIIALILLIIRCTLPKTKDTTFGKKAEKMAVPPDKIIDIEEAEKKGEKQNGSDAKEEPRRDFQQRQDARVLTGHNEDIYQIQASIENLQSMLNNLTLRYKSDSEKQIQKKINRKTEEATLEEYYDDADDEDDEEEDHDVENEDGEDVKENEEVTEDDVEEVSQEHLLEDSDGIEDSKLEKIIPTSYSQGSEISQELQLANYPKAKAKWECQVCEKKLYQEKGLKDHIKRKHQAPTCGNGLQLVCPPSSVIEIRQQGNSKADTSIKRQNSTRKITKKSMIQNTSVSVQNETQGGTSSKRIPTQPKYNQETLSRTESVRLQPRRKGQMNRSYSTRQQFKPPFSSTGRYETSF